jgi:hypothetical protein
MEKGYVDTFRMSEVFILNNQEELLKLINEGLILSTVQTSDNWIKYPIYAIHSHSALHLSEKEIVKGKKLPIERHDVKWTVSEGSISMPIRMNDLYNSNGYYGCRCNTKNLNSILALLNLNRTNFCIGEELLRFKLTGGVELLVYVDDSLTDDKIYKI